MVLTCTSPLQDQIQTMKKIYPILTAITFFFCSLHTLIAQFPMVGTPSTNQSPKGNVKISGTLIDSSTAKSVEYATIALYKLPGDKAVDGAVTDEKGKFSFTKIEAGEYKLQIVALDSQNNFIKSNKITVRVGSQSNSSINVVSPANAISVFALPSTFG
jgi:uncharacterized surface anchored protein